MAIGRRAMTKKRARRAKFADLVILAQNTENTALDGNLRGRYVDGFHRIGDYDSKRLTHSKRFDLLLKRIEMPKWAIGSAILQQNARASGTAVNPASHATWGSSPLVSSV